MLVYVCFMPANGDFLKEKGANFGIDNASLLYNGAYILSTYEPQVSHGFWTRVPRRWTRLKLLRSCIRG